MGVSRWHWSLTINQFGCNFIRKLQPGLGVQETWSRADRAVGWQVTSSCESNCEQGWWVLNTVTSSVDSKRSILRLRLNNRSLWYIKYGQQFKFHFEKNSICLWQMFPKTGTCNMDNNQGRIVAKCIYLNCTFAIAVADCYFQFWPIKIIFCASPYHSEANTDCIALHLETLRSNKEPASGRKPPDKRTNPWAGDIKWKLNRKAEEHKAERAEHFVCRHSEEDGKWDGGSGMCFAAASRSCGGTMLVCTLTKCYTTAFSNSGHVLRWIIEPLNSLHR